MGWDQLWSWIVARGAELQSGHRRRRPQACAGGVPMKRGAALTRLRARALLAGQANIDIAELRDRLRSSLTAQERDLTARELTRLEGELVKSLATG